MKYWILAIRPKTLTASLGPALLGIALAYFLEAQINLLIALLTLLCALFLQISTNLVNDYYDGIRGTDTERRIGPTRVTVSGMLSAEAVKKGFITTFVISFILGVYLMVHGGLPIVLIGLSSILFAYIYTGGPIPLSHFALGEVLAFIFFGPIAVWGSFYLQTKTHSPLALLLGTGPGFISAALMAINNLRDQFNDRIANKHTLAVIAGETHSRLIPLTFIALSLAVPIVFYYLMKTPLLVFLVCLTPFLFKTEWQRVYSGPIDQELNNSLAATGKFLFLYCLVFSIILIFPLI